MDMNFSRLSQEMAQTLLNVFKRLKPVPVASPIRRLRADKIFAVKPLSDCRNHAGKHRQKGGYHEEILVLVFRDNLLHCRTSGAVAVPGHGTERIRSRTAGTACGNGQSGTLPLLPRRYATDPPLDFRCHAAADGLGGATHLRYLLRLP